MDEVLQRSLTYGLFTTTALLPSLYTTKGKGRKWTRYITKPILTAMLMYLFYAALPTSRRNFYTLLEVDVGASKSEILQAYRSVSKRLHPDKIAAAEANGVLPRRPPAFQDMSNEELFMEIKKAQEVLLNDTRKSNYDRFGDYKHGDIDEKATIILVCLALVAHLLCFCVGFIVSYPKHVTFARQVFVVYNLAMLCNELQIRFVENGDSLAFLPYIRSLVPFERIHFFRALFPCALCASLCLAAWQFTDQVAMRMALLKALLSTNRVLTERTQELLRVTAYLKSNDPLSTAAIRVQQLQAQQQLQEAAVRTNLPGSTQCERSNGKPSGKEGKEGQESTVPSQLAASVPNSGVTSPKPVTAAARPPPGKEKDDVAEWGAFTNTLNDEQKELFKRMIADQYRKAEADAHEREKAKSRFDINWGQLLMWVCVLYVWIYYK